MEDQIAKLIKESDKSGSSYKIDDSVLQELVLQDTQQTNVPPVDDNNQDNKKIENSGSNDSPNIDQEVLSMLSEDNTSNSASDISLSDVAAQIGSTLSSAVDSTISGVKHVYDFISDATETALREAPAETTLNIAGTTAGIKYGGLTGGFLLGGASAAVGRELDEALFDATNGKYGKNVDETFLQNIAKGYMWQAGGEVAGRILKPLVEGALRVSGISPLAEKIFNKIYPHADEVSHLATVDLVTKGDGTDRTLIEASRNVLGSKRGVTAFEASKGAVGSYKIQVAEHLPEYKQAINERANVLYNNLSRYTKGAVPDKVLGKNIKDVLKVYSEGLNKQVDTAAKELSKYQNLVYNPRDFYLSAVSKLRRNTNIPSDIKEKILAKLKTHLTVPESGGKNVMLLDSDGLPVIQSPAGKVKPAVTLKTIQQLETDIKNTIESFKVSTGSGGPEGAWFQDAIQNGINKIIDEGQLTKGGKYVKAADSYINFKQAARLAKKNLEKVKAIKQIGVNELTQEGSKQMSDKAIINKVFSDPKTFNTFQDILANVAPEKVDILRAGFAKRFLDTAALKGFTPEGIRSHIAQYGEEALRDIMGDEYVTALKDTAAILGASKEATKNLPTQGTGFKLRTTSAALSSAIVGSLAYANALGIKYLWNPDRFVKNLFDPKAAERYASILTRKLTKSPSSYASYISTMIQLEKEGALRFEGGRPPSKDEYDALVDKINNDLNINTDITPNEQISNDVLDMLQSDSGNTDSNNNGSVRDNTSSVQQGGDETTAARGGTNTTKEVIKSEEGEKFRAYKDKLGNLTIGIGFNMDQNGAEKLWKQAGVSIPFKLAREGVPITPEDSEKLFNIVHQRVKEKAPMIIKNYGTLSDIRKAAIDSLIYQLGDSGLKKFKKFISAVENNNWELASKELLNSRFAKQTPERAKRTAAMLLDDNTNI